jgi:hypothetical protein
MYVCPCCQQAEPMTKVDVINVEEAVASDKLTKDDVFKRTYLGHGRQSSVFVFQGHEGPFRKHIHVTHDEIGYVLGGSGWVIPSNTPHSGEFGDPCTVLFISSPIDDEENPDRVWLD